MKAMVLAAGLGTRLRPLTDSRPKALIEVGGAPILELVLRRLIAAGVTEAVVNLHHHAEMIARFLESKGGFGIRIELSREADLLDTGGGLKKAAPFFDDGKPFFLHNADVLSGVDLAALYRRHLQKAPLATLAVRARKGSRGLLFSREGLLRGRYGASGEEWAAGPVPGAERLAFDGIHVISPAIFGKLSETGAFSIAAAYVRLAGLGERIEAFRTDGTSWHDIGDAGKLEAARRDLEA